MTTITSVPAVDLSRFTDRARKVVKLAQQEALRLGHEYTGTEHLLLGMVKEGSGVAANVLKNLDVDLRKVRQEVEKLVQGGGPAVECGEVPLTVPAQAALRHAADEAQALKHGYVGTEHILLGLLRMPECVASQALLNLELKLEDVRQEVLNLLGHGDDAAVPLNRLSGELGEKKAECLLAHAPKILDLSSSPLEHETDPMRRTMREAVRCHNQQVDDVTLADLLQVDDVTLADLLRDHDAAWRLGREAYRTHEAYFAEVLDRYRKRDQWRQEGRIHPFCILGHGRSGKDFSAELLTQLGPCHATTGERIAYSGSTSRLIYRLIAQDLGIDADRAYRERHQHREFWYHWANGLRSHDASLLARMALADGDLVVGLRDFCEVEAVRHRHLCRWIIWVENPRVPVDPTVAFGPEDCDLTIHNGGSRSEFAEKWRLLLPALCS